ncbi:MAG: 16S rRNA (guanine(527)-N(7))-methyltransferase RsmG [Campylobacterota bacterium]|nr:16S rRNA (guanine(527)-N(7))-methyltransferase RsmG [Campylobacterota bacterium]
MDIRAELQRDKIDLNDTFYRNVSRYKEHLFRWNKIHNLTGAKSEEIIDDFIYDAIYPISFIDSIDSIMDIGTGAGFPGLILAMALPQTEVTLVEPLQKRASFLQFIKADLKLNNVHVKSCRVEALPRGSFDLITSRAVTDTAMLLKLSSSHIKKGTQILFYKGEQVFDEVDETLDYEIIKAKNRHYLKIQM